LDGSRSDQGHVTRHKAEDPQQLEKVARGEGTGKLRVEHLERDQVDMSEILRGTPRPATGTGG
jgi:hypothetical protein